MVFGWRWLDGPAAARIGIFPPMGFSAASVSEGFQRGKEKPFGASAGAYLLSRWKINVPGRPEGVRVRAESPLQAAVYANFAEKNVWGLDAPHQRGLGLAVLWASRRLLIPECSKGGREKPFGAPAGAIPLSPMRE